MSELSSGDAVARVRRFVKVNRADGKSHIMSHECLAIDDLAALAERAERADALKAERDLARDEARTYMGEQGAWLANRAAAAEARVVELQAVLADVESTLLAWWTDTPQTELQRLLPKIRAALAAVNIERTQEWRDLNASGDGAMNQTSPFGAAVERTQE